MSIIALIPARGGSERIPRKNIRMLAGHPLIGYAIAGAWRARIFSRVYVSTEDETIGEIAVNYGAGWIKRPTEYAAVDSKDEDWIRSAMGNGKETRDAAGFVILRPTNPFRKAETIQKAWACWKINHPPYDSLRTTRSVKDHPDKSWIYCESGELIPLCGYLPQGVEKKFAKAYDLPMQSLPKMHISSGCIQIFDKYTFNSNGDHTGLKVLHYETSKEEQFDLNDEWDWILAEALIERGLATLEKI